LHLLMMSMEHLQNPSLRLQCSMITAQHQLMTSMDHLVTYSPGWSLFADYENVPVYNPIDTNSVETNTEVFEYEYEEEPLTSYISVNSLLEEEQSYGSPGENTLQNVPVEEAEYVSDVSDDDSGDDYDSYDDYEEELPSYIIPAADAYQASPSISVEYASPRDQQGLVIDLTENYDDDDDDDDYETAVYGQRLTGISSSHSSHNILSSLRHHRLLRSRL